MVCPIKEGSLPPYKLTYYRFYNMATLHFRSFLGQSNAQFALLMALPLLMIAQWPFLMAPHEGPKWMILVILGAFLASVFLRQMTSLSFKGPTSNLKLPGITLSVPGLLFLVFFISIGIGVIYTPHFFDGMSRFAFWVSGGLIFLAASKESSRSKHYFARLQMSLCVTAGLLSLHYWYAYFFLFGQKDFDKLVNYSLIGHFNFTSDVLIILIPFLLWTALHRRKGPIFWLSLMGLLSSGFMLLASGSLGGMGGLLVGGLVALPLSLRHLKQRRTDPAHVRPLQKRILPWVLLLIVLAPLTKIVVDHMPSQLKEQMFSRAIWWEAIKEEDLTEAKNLPPLAPFWVSIAPIMGARTPMWAATTAMICDRPGLGFGTGSFLYAYPHYKSQFNLFHDDEIKGHEIRTNPHNLFLQIASENGVPTALLFFGLYGWLTFKVLLKAWLDPDPLWTIGLWSLIAAILDAMVNHVFFNPGSLMMASLMFGTLYGALKIENRALFSLPLNTLGSKTFLLVGHLFIFWVLSFPVRSFVSEYFVSKAFHLASESPPASDRFILAAWQNAISWSPYNAQAIYGMASFDLKKGKLQEAEVRVNDFLRLCPDYSPVLSLLAEVMIKAKRFEEAEIELEKALSLDRDNSILKDRLGAVKRFNQKHRP